MIEKQGQVIKVISGFYDVVSDDNVYRLRASGTLRDTNQNPLVGDFVKFRNDAILFEILPRKNYLTRPKVSNVDQVVIVTALDHPKFSSMLLDKFLAIIEFQNIKPIIFFTKSDIGDRTPYLDYKSQNYESYLISNNNLDESQIHVLKSVLKNKLSVFTGQSGAGKSTTINNILDLNLKTKEISKFLGRGKHTTRIVEIFQKDNIRIIDTPGFSSLEINLTKKELSKSYKDFKEWSKQCKFNSCLHYKENECNVKKELKLGNLLPSRYDNYIKILLELND